MKLPCLLVLLRSEIKQSRFAAVMAAMFPLTAPLAFIVMSLSKNVETRAAALGVFTQMCLMLLPVSACLWATVLFSGVFEVSPQVLLVRERHFISKGAIRVLLLQALVVLVSLAILYASKVEQNDSARALMEIAGVTTGVYFMVMALCTKLIGVSFPGIVITLFASLCAYGNYLGWLMLPNWWLLVQGTRSPTTQLAIMSTTCALLCVLLYVNERVASYSC